MTVFIYNDQVDDIWCGIYDAWMSGLGHDHVRLEPAGRNRELFCQYREVVRDAKKAEKVTKSMWEKLSEDVYEFVFKSALSQDQDCGDRIYRFLIYAFHFGTKVMDMLQVPEVHYVFQMHRNVVREYQHMLGFVRFSNTKERILLGRIGPKNDITMLLADHFADRLSRENWILYDCNRKKAAVHQKGLGWVMVEVSSSEWQNRLSKGTDEEEYECLWKIFHQSITIKERENPGCQQTLLPLRFCSYMLEFH